MTVQLLLRWLLPYCSDDITTATVTVTGRHYCSLYFLLIAIAGIGTIVTITFTIAIAISLTNLLLVMLFLRRLILSLLVVVVVAVVVVVVVIKVVQTGFTWAFRHDWVGLFGVIKVAGLDLIPHRIVLVVLLLAFLSSFCCRLAKNLGSRGALGLG